MRRLLLFPFSLLYGLIIRFRNFLFNFGILPSKSFDIPIIGVGNLSVGGNGKTPTTEYLIRLLKQDFKVAVLSRGYGRKTNGFVEAKMSHNYHDIGDEPKQIIQKFPDIILAVCGKRVRGVKRLLKLHPDIQVILLDDSFQHRHIQPGITLLLTDYFHPYTQDWLLPAGRLREHRKNYIRADAILITKSPKVLSPFTIRNTLDDIKPQDYQNLYFNYIHYTGLIPYHDEHKTLIKKKFTNILLFSGVANPYHIEEYLKDRCSFLESIQFKDHHQYREKDIDKILDFFSGIISKNKIIVTTEKDMMRLNSLDLHDKLKGIALFYLEMEFEFHPSPDNNFDDYILNYVRKSHTND